MIKFTKHSNMLVILIVLLSAILFDNYILYGCEDGESLYITVEQKKKVFPGLETSLKPPIKKPVVFFNLKNNWAGEGIALYKNKEGQFYIIYEIYGSGLPVVLKEKYPVEQVSKSNWKFTIKRKGKCLNFSIVKKESIYKIFLFNLELKYSD